MKDPFWGRMLVDHRVAVVRPGDHPKHRSMALPSVPELHWIESASAERVSAASFMLQPYYGGLWLPKTMKAPSISTQVRQVFHDFFGDLLAGPPPPLEEWVDLEEIPHEIRRRALDLATLHRRAYFIERHATVGAWEVVRALRSRDNRPVQWKCVGVAYPFEQPGLPD